MTAVMAAGVRVASQKVKKPKVKVVKEKKKVRLRPAEDLNTYLKAFPRYPLLTPQQEIDNGRVLRDPASTPEAKEKARNTLILSNTRLVVAEAMRFSKKAPINTSVMDLVSEGLFGLFDAARRYDPERPCKFSTYATWWIRRYIRKAITGARVIRIPYYMNGILSRHPWTFCRLVSELKRDPTDQEIADAMEIRLSELTRTTDVAQSTKVFNPTIDSPEGSPMDSVRDNRDPNQEALFDACHDNVWLVLDKMPSEERNILMLRYNLGMDPNQQPKKYTFSDIGNILGMSREKARQLEKKATDTFLAFYVKERKNFEDL